MAITANHRATLERGVLFLAAGLMAAVLAFPAALNAAEDEDEVKRDAFRVCADPSNMPFSSQDLDGIENKIAALFAEDLGLPVEYKWLPQQFGFARNTLKKWLPEKNRYACDVITGTTSGLEVGKTTEPYYHSTYVMVYVKGRGLDNVKSPEDLSALPEEKKQSLRIGAFTGAPTVSWLLQHGMLTQLVGYRSQSSNYEEDPGDIIKDDLVNGDLDVALVWGPIGGYYASRVDSAELEVIPFESKQGLVFDFPISMGVRYGEDEWLATIEGLIEKNSGEIAAILKEYNVPLVPEEQRTVLPASDDDD